MIPINPIQRLFLKSRKLMRIQGSKEVVRHKEWHRGDDLLSEDYLPYLTPTADYSPRLRRLLDNYISSAKMVVQPTHYATNQGIGEVAFIAVPADQIWEVCQIIGSVQIDANIGNRTCNITIEGHIIDPDGVPPLPIIAFTATTGIVLVGGELGGSILPEGLAPDLVTNTNTVLALVADENFLPIRLNPGATIAHMNDNLAVGIGDVMEIGVHYRRVA